MGRSAAAGGIGGDQDDVLFRRHDLPLYRLFVVWSSARGAQAVHVRLNVVEAELADLSWSETMSAAGDEMPRGSRYVRTWYPHGQGLKLRSERSRSSMQRGLETRQRSEVPRRVWRVDRGVHDAWAGANAGDVETYHTSSSSSMYMSCGDMLGIWNVGYVVKRTRN